MNGDFSNMSQLVDSHTTSIKKIEQQLGKLSASLNQRKNGSLPSDTIQNPKKDGYCMAIATRSGKVLNDPISTGTKHEQVLEQAGREEDEAEQVYDLEDAQPIAKQARAKEKEVKGTMPLQQILRPPPFFPQRLKKKVEDGKFVKFITTLRQLSVNIPLVEALEQMPGYAKFMKDLVTKKKVVNIDLTDNVHHYSAIATRSLVQKKEEPGAFTIPCTIRSIEFLKALCDLGACINLMPLAIYKQLGLGVPKPTAMRLMMADRSVKRPVGILCDVLVKVDTFIFPANFVILDCEVDFEVPIILGRPFLAIGRALVDVERGELKFKLNKEEVNFNIWRSMKQPHDMNVVSAIEVFDEEEMGASIKERLAVETLTAVLMNFETDFRSDYVETVNALQCMGAHYYAPKKLDLDLKNRSSPPAKPSIEEPPVLELKQLPSHLRYVFLGANNTSPVILVADLNDERVQAVIKVLIRYKRAIGWTIADIIGIPLGICTHKIQLEEDCNPSIEHQRRLNPHIQEVVKKEIIKWLDIGVVYPISDSHWVSPVQCVPKKGGMTVVVNAKNELVPQRLVTAWRVCMDYRKLNKWTLKDHFLMPFLDQMLDRLGGKGWFFFLDGYSGYNPISIAPEDLEKTTFTCPYGTYAFKRMPFGLCDAPTTFQRCKMFIF
ncbi:uncharacterized protein LOC125837400 [Solanum verrucosum]|uniref:uncharacterized protein LOC125837400 n=1 Tax=Solanum verrucosum TaxID=315347 RepID=UPI0020D09326|nr:uncharacterized protein LOC125837400 [Solanum verrucosum]